jgi:hypothetical protein
VKLEGLKGLQKDFEAVKLTALEATGNNEPWPPQEGEGDNLAYSLWAGAGFPELPKERPTGGVFPYLLGLAARATWAEVDGNDSKYDLPMGGW